MSINAGMTPTTLPGLLAADLEQIDHDPDAARRCAELLRVLAERFPDKYDTRGYRAALTDAADDLEGQADIMDERRERDMAEDDFQQREAMRRRRELIGCALGSRVR